MKRTRPEPHSLDERLATEAQKLKADAKLLPPGKQREALLKKARQIDVAAHVNEWLRSSGLQAPK